MEVCICVVVDPLRMTEQDFIVAGEERRSLKVGKGRRIVAVGC